MQTVEPQPIQTPSTGLSLVVAAPTIDDAQLRWLDGFRWTPEAAGLGTISGLACGAVDSRDTDSLGQPDPLEFEPFLLWVAEKCSTKARARDWQGRARRALLAEQSFLIAREFWSGAATGLDGNLHLAAYDSATVLTSGAVSATVALTLVDSALTRQLRNRRGMVHARPELVDIWTAARLLRIEGGVTLTPLGHIVVADAGYTGDGPRPAANQAPTAADGSSQWVYGTDLISLRLGPAETLPASAGDADAIVRPTNDLIVWAQRPAAYQWDHTAHVAAEVSQGALV